MVIFVGGPAAWNPDVVDLGFGAELVLNELLELLHLGLAANGVEEERVGEVHQAHLCRKREQLSLKARPVTDPTS